jgi:uncharacterized membrane protein
MRKVDLAIPAMVFVGLLFWLVILRPASVQQFIESLMR